MRLKAGFAFIATAIVASCDAPPAQNTPPESNVVNAVVTDQAYPSGADGNQIITGSGTVNAPGGSVPSGGTPAGGGQQSGAGQGNQQGNSQ